MPNHGLNFTDLKDLWLLCCNVTGTKSRNKANQTKPELDPLVTYGKAA